MSSGSIIRLVRPRRDPHLLYGTSLHGSQASQRHEPSQEAHL